MTLKDIDIMLQSLKVCTVSMGAEQSADFKHVLDELKMAMFADDTVVFNKSVEKLEKMVDSWTGVRNNV